MKRDAFKSLPDMHALFLRPVHGVAFLDSEGVEEGLEVADGDIHTVAVNRFAMFLEGRAAGLHYLSSEYFKKIRVTRKGNRFIKSDDDVFLGLHLTLDSLGRFKDPQIMFTSSDNEVFKVKLLKHVEYFWRLPPSKQGKLEIWIPIRFHAN